VLCAFARQKSRAKAQSTQRNQEQVIDQAAGDSRFHHTQGAKVGAMLSEMIFQPSRV
jgi:hypothetical protein